MSSEIGNTKDSGNKGNNFPYQKAVIVQLQAIVAALQGGGAGSVNVTNPFNLEATQQVVSASLAAILNFIKDTPNKPTNPASGYVKNITDTTVHDVIVAGGVNIFNYLTQILVTNASTTTGTVVDIIDEDGTILYTGYAGAGGGFSVSFPTPLKQHAANKKIQAQCTTTGTNVYVSISGYKI